MSWKCLENVDLVPRATLPKSLEHFHVIFICIPRSDVCIVTPVWTRVEIPVGVYRRTYGNDRISRGCLGILPSLSLIPFHYFGISLFEIAARFG